MRVLLAQLMLVVGLMAGQFHIMIEDLPPQNYVDKNGEIKGFSVDTVKLILQRLGYKDEKIEVVPWARGMVALETEPNAILFSMAYTPERAEKFKLVYPMAIAKTYFFTHKDSNVKIESVEDAKKYRQGVVKDFSQHKNLLKQGFTDFDFSPDVETMIKKAIMKRVDVISLIPFQLYSDEFSNLDVKSLRKIEVSYAESRHAIGFNKAFPDAEIKKWQAELDKIKKSGEFDKIFKKYVRE